MHALKYVKSGRTIGFFAGLVVAGPHLLPAVALDTYEFAQVGYIVVVCMLAGMAISVLFALLDRLIDKVAPPKPQK